MPLYCYKCDDCGFENEEFQHIKDEPYDLCPECRVDSYHRVVAPVHTDLQEYNKPIVMHSIGLNSDEEIREFQRRNPGTQCSDNPDDPLYGVPVIKSRGEKLRVLKKEGFVEKN